MDYQLESSSKRLVDDLKAVRADMDQLIAALKADSRSVSSATVTRFNEAMQRMRTRLATTKALASARTRSAAGEVDVFAHQHPWRTATVAATAGIVVGALIALVTSRH